MSLGFELMLWIVTLGIEGWWLVVRGLGVEVRDWVAGWVLKLYVLATSKVISRRVS